MTSHQLAAALLSEPDLPILVREPILGQEFLVDTVTVEGQDVVIELEQQ